MKNPSQTKPLPYLQILLLTCGLFVRAQYARAIELTDIRTGFHRTYSRVVLQFDSQVKFQVIKDVENGAVIIDVLGIDKTRTYQNPGVHRDDPFLKSVSLRQTGQLLSVAAILKRTNLRVDHFYMHWPFRIVVDIYRDSTPTVPAVSTRVSKINETLKPERTVGKDSVQTDSLKLAELDSTLQSTRVDSLTLMNAPEYDNTDGLIVDTILPFQRSLDSVKTELQKITGKKASSETASTSKSELVIAVIAGFVLLDAVILVVYLKGRSGRNPVRQKRKEKPVPGAKSPKHQFADVLKSALDDNEIEEVRKEPETVTGKPVVRNAALTYESWKSRMTPPVERKAVAPDLKAVAKDLGSILSATTAMPEVTEEELIGKDGVEFLENLRRHSFS